MKTIFDVIDQIVSDKKPYQLKPDDEFSPYVVQRGLSMINPQTADILNQTTNILHKSADNQMVFDLCRMLTPKVKGRIPWIKKTPKQGSKNISPSKIKELAIILERSETTIRSYLEVDPNFLDQYLEKS